MIEQRVQPGLDFKIQDFCTAMCYPYIHLSGEKRNGTIWPYITMCYIYLYAVLRNENDLVYSCRINYNTWESHLAHKANKTTSVIRRFSSHKFGVTLALHISWLISSWDDSDKPRINHHIWLCSYISPTGHFPHLIPFNQRELLENAGTLQFEMYKDLPWSNYEF